MNKFPHLAFCVAVLMCSNSFVSAQEFVDGVDLTTTKAPWTIRILGNDLDITNVQAKPNEASGYFMMMSSSTKLKVSVFIEPVDKCKTSEECRDHVLNLGNPAWGKYEQLAKGKIKDFSYFEFYRPEPQGQPLKMLDMYAEFVADGFWVDLHISKVLYTRADHALFEKVVNSVVFVPRKDVRIVRFLFGGSQAGAHYMVDARTAIDILNEKNPDAADWWKNNAGHTLRPRHSLAFAAEVCELAPDDNVD